MVRQRPPNGEGGQSAAPHEQRRGIAHEAYRPLSDDATACLDEVGLIVSRFDQLDARSKRAFFREGWVTVSRSQPMSARAMQELPTPPLAKALASVLQALLTPAVFDGLVRAQLDDLQAAREKARKQGREFQATWIVIRDCGWIVWSLVKWPFIALLECIGGALSG